MSENNVSICKHKGKVFSGSLREAAKKEIKIRRQRTAHARKFARKWHIAKQKGLANIR